MILEDVLFKQCRFCHDKMKYHSSVMNNIIIDSENRFIKPVFNGIVHNKISFDSKCSVKYDINITVGSIVGICWFEIACNNCKYYNTIGLEFYHNNFDIYCDFLDESILFPTLRVRNYCEDINSEYQTEVVLFGNVDAYHIIDFIDFNKSISEIKQEIKVKLTFL